MADLFLSGPMWLVGCGNMGSAMLEGWLTAGVDPAHVTVIRPSGRPCAAAAVRVLTDFPEDEVPAVVVLAMKPYHLDLVAPGLAPILDPESLLVSILAGVEQASLRARLPAPRTIVKAMPNLPVGLGKGVVCLYSDSEDQVARAMTSGLMAALGHAEWFDSEQAFQLAGHLTGAGPAFLFRFIEGLAAAAETLGLEPDQAARLAAAMVEGASAMARGSDEGPARLAQRVASPGGTTQAGLQVLDEDRALFDLLQRTLDASRRRGLEMAAEARPKEGTS